MTRSTLLNSVALAFCLLTNLLCLHARAQDVDTYHGVVLVYHHVAEDTPAVTSISPRDFERQLAFLESHQFEIWPLADIVDALEKQQQIPDKVAAITFDDNYRSVYSEAYPRLKKRGWPFTIFVSTDAVDKGINMQSSWEQMREMAAHGATIANHTSSHAHLLARLPQESDRSWQQRIRADIDKAQRRIKEEIGSSPTLFAYPYGEFNPALTGLVSSMGYTAIGQQSGPAYPLAISKALPRFPFAGNYADIDDFSLKVLSLPLPVQAVDYPPGPLPYDETSPALTLTLQPGPYDARRLRCYGSGQGLLKLQWLDEWTVRVTANKPIPVGRSRFNCPLPGKQRSQGILRYHWYTQPWIRLSEDGSLTD